MPTMLETCTKHTKKIFCELLKNANAQPIALQDTSFQSPSIIPGFATLHQQPYTASQMSAASWL
jgi:hypothetical protein